MADNDRTKLTVWQWLNMVFLVAFASSLIWAWDANQNRITDIQKARRESCEQTYKSFRQVFEPFFAKNPKGKQKRDQDKFNRIVDAKILHCAIQTRTVSTTNSYTTK